MDQRGHTYLATRALGLLEERGAAPELTGLLKTHLRTVAIGAWIPDLQDARKGSGKVDNHVLKMKPYKGPEQERFTMTKKAMLGALGADRAVSGWLTQDTTLTDAWWGDAYKADPAPGQHLANRAMALTVTLKDLLILGDDGVAAAVPGTVSFAGQLDPEARSSAQQVATYFFMLSHFVADSCMPCHCDGRYLSAYGNGLHKELEDHWAKRIGPFFDKARLLKSADTPDQMLEAAQAKDTEFGLEFPNAIPAIVASDVWKEIVFVCRGSFAVQNLIAPRDAYPFGGTAKCKFDDVFAGDAGQALLQTLDRVALQDAAFNIAMIWQQVWKVF